SALRSGSQCTCGAGQVWLTHRADFQYARPLIRSRVMRRNLCSLGVTMLIAMLVLVTTPAHGPGCSRGCFEISTANSQRFVLLGGDFTYSLQHAGSGFAPNLGGQYNQWANRAVRVWDTIVPLSCPNDGVTQLTIGVGNYANPQWTVRATCGSQ